MPGSLFWTYFAGAALIVRGHGDDVRIQARLASLLLEDHDLSVVHHPSYP
jgi:hypothetical protein